MYCRSIAATLFAICLGLVLSCTPAPGRYTVAQASTDHATAVSTPTPDSSGQTAVVKSVRANLRDKPSKAGASVTTLEQVRGGNLQSRRQLVTIKRLKSLGGNSDQTVTRVNLTANRVIRLFGIREVSADGVTTKATSVKILLDRLNQRPVPATNAAAKESPDGVTWLDRIQHEASRQIIIKLSAPFIHCH